jgi:tripartite-type tricarboxylate transporter receptor subunit TctC
MTIVLTCVIVQKHGAAMVSTQQEIRMNIMKSVLGVVLAAAVSTALAQSYPNKPVTLISSFAAGSSVDIIARVVAKAMSESMGQQVIVEPKPGAGGDIATGYIARAPKDGYVLGMASPGPLTVNPLLRKKMPYDPIKDIAPISLIGRGPNVILVNPQVPAKTLPELISYVKAHPGKVGYASAGLGTSGHLAGELFKHLTKTDILHVPYKGNGEAVTDVIGGQVQVLFSGVPPILASIQAGKLRPIAIADTKRSPLLPDVPTVAEAGLPGAESGAWYGMIAPAGTPPEILDRIHAELGKALARPDVREQLQKIGVDPVFMPRAEFASMIKNETIKWRELFKAANIKPE